MLLQAYLVLALLQQLRALAQGPLRALHGHASHVSAILMQLPASRGMCQL
jgi:hypothetical protein